MFFIDADRLDYTAINEALRRSGPVCRITGCLGQRFIAAGMSDTESPATPSGRI